MCPETAQQYSAKAVEGYSELNIMQYAKREGKVKGTLSKDAKLPAG